MSRDEVGDQQIAGVETRGKSLFRQVAYIIVALIIFLFALDLMISSLQHLGQAAAEAIILATSNPFTGLFIGLLVTAIIQSSSTTTAMTVALVASGSITIEGALPIIMGANVGTTITSTIVSLGFITKKKEFRRAVAAGTFHDFFNILTAAILFPLEYYYGVLSSTSQYIATRFFNEPMGVSHTDFSILSVFNPIVRFLVDIIPYGFILAILSFALLFGSILFFRKVLSDLFGFGSQGALQRFLFQHPFKSFGWGLIITAAIRSSTVTTSLVVPLVARKVVRLHSAVPFILGANIGTTVTAFIAAMFNSNAAISIAIAHFLFNLIGVLIFFPVPYLREIPINLANGLGRITLKYRLAGFLYLLLTFFFVPFSLIYLNKGRVQAQHLTYQRLASGQTSYYTVLVKNYDHNQLSSWSVYPSEATERSEPAQIFTVYRRKNLIFMNNELYELNKAGFCRDEEANGKKYRVCLREILPSLAINPRITLDSIYVFEKTQYNDKDSVKTHILISARQNVVVRKEMLDKYGNVLEREELFELTMER